MADAAKDCRGRISTRRGGDPARTLDRLRQLERRLGGESVPDDRRKQFGELELEARLLAEAQKRLADAARQQAQARQQGQSGGAPSTSTGQSGSQGQRGSAAGAGTDGSPAADRRQAQEQESLALRSEALEKPAVARQPRRFPARRRRAPRWGAGRTRPWQPSEDMRKAAVMRARRRRCRRRRSRSRRSGIAGEDTLTRARHPCMAGDGGNRERRGCRSARWPPPGAPSRRGRRAALRDAVERATRPPKRAEPARSGRDAKGPREGPGCRVSSSGRSTRPPAGPGDDAAKAVAIR